MCCYGCSKGATAVCSRLIIICSRYGQARSAPSPRLCLHCHRITHGQKERVSPDFCPCVGATRQELRAHSTNRLDGIDTGGEPASSLGLVLPLSTLAEGEHGASGLRRCQRVLLLLLQVRVQLLLLHVLLQLLLQVSLLLHRLRVQVRLLCLLRLQRGLVSMHCANKLVVGHGTLCAECRATRHAAVHVRIRAEPLLLLLLRHVHRHLLLLLLL